MKKYILFLTVILFFICQCYVFRAKIEKTNSLLLTNIEVLAADESYNGSAEKEEKTWQEGPFVDDYNRIFYFVYTKIDCHGSGKIECLPNYSTDIVYKG